ncbi:MAG TPA: SMI1/KNR4 family protein [Archangium sp.]|uniref:SMI1/KNR4 family protein n=1 Tax=Archangium sp. TaxID=1872627 RepID=UPI002E35BB4A|nr:SMI1/KNR4 family protein [Archangium sp.]HEX5748537.1 SMI1/KNR4 family protein [Archangium sp.]
MSPIITESEPPVSKARIQEVERFIGSELPEPYKRFLLKHNGGTPKPCEFLFRSKDKPPRPALLSWFLAIHDGPYENFLEHFKDFKGRIPDDTVAIARDPGGDLILIGLRDPLRGKIFFWTKKLESLDGSPTPPELLHEVADDFDSFLNSLFDT